MEITMAKHRTPLKLSDDERTFLFDFTRKGIRPAREIKRALVLLNSTDPTLDNSALAQRFGVSRATVENVQRHYTEGVAWNGRCMRRRAVGSPRRSPNAKKPTSRPLPARSRLQDRLVGRCR
jgi:hypothetical protein